MQIAPIFSPMSQLTILVAGHWRQKPSFAQKGSEPLATSRSLGMVQDWVLLQSWAESRDDPVSHSLMAAACGRC